jgi:hypothetical protein
VLIRVVNSPSTFKLHKRNGSIDFQLQNRYFGIGIELAANGPLHAGDHIADMIEQLSTIVAGGYLESYDQDIDIRCWKSKTYCIGAE